MKFLTLLLVFICHSSFSLNLPGPLVYVVTPSSKPRIDEGRSAPQPFYYHNWVRRMDSQQNVTTSTTTPAPKVKTPDLIFAEFESDNMKNIRKLLEKERIAPKTSTTTSLPIYVTEEKPQHASAETQHQHNFGSPSNNNEVKYKDMTDYFALYNNMYENVNVPPPVPVFLPTTTTQRPTSPSSTVQRPTTQKTTTKATTTTPPTPAAVQNVQNIWNIIDSQKQEQYSGMWNEVPITSGDDKKMEAEQTPVTLEEKPLETIDDDEVKIDDNFALPGFGTNSGIGGENESRAIRTEPSIRFPYVNLKPFQLKNLRKPLYNVVTNNKKGNNNNMLTSLDDFIEIKNPVRGEAQDVVNMVPVRQPIDRYNPAQPYLPDYGKIKQSGPSVTPMKAVANLVPPPPPRPPKVTDNDFPSPSTYEQFPPFAPSAADSAPPPPPAPKPAYQPPMETAPDSGSDDSDDGPPLDLGYRYKPPSAPVPSFAPTLPPLQKPGGGYSYSKPFGGYSYDKPSMTAEAPPTDSDFPGYHYDKPAPMPEKPDFSGYHYNKPDPMPEKPDFSGYHDAPPKDAPSYGPDYPEFIFDKPHDDGMKDMKGSDMKGGDDDMGMMPPPMPDAKPGSPDDSGFPHDFPGDFKYHHDFDDHDHDFHHYHHHTTTTTTTTTEMPRVNRYSYYYLGKKLYYLPLYFSVYFIVYVGALIIKAVLRHKIVYPNSWRPNDQTATFFSKRSVDDWDSSHNLHELTGRVTRAIATAAEKYMDSKKEKEN